MSHYGVSLPIAQYRDPKSNEMLDNFATCYRAKGKYSRKFETWTNAGAGGDAFKPYVTDVDEAMIYLRSHMGLQAIKMNQGVIQRPA
jgi:hypothetical protein